ncbi:MAG: orotidine-5'-phosphate decarboxylase [Thermoplasmata archaeon]|nr:orotidine-5'-phosphate decarboxylase [Euryarchaeota archaeon]RLF64587.1 MAG: orotidine-5'-phosphate decarboxylase [Thermoplasmata archaeon]
MVLRINDYGLIVALDILDERHLMKVVVDTAEYVSAYKIGWPAILSNGVEIIKKVSDYAPVICDFKIADIPEISRIIAEKAFENGARGVIVHSFVGLYTLQSVVEVARSYESQVFALVYMTHKGVEDVFSRVYDRLLEIIESADVDGIVAPATRPSIIRDVRKHFESKIIISPGVGAQGGELVETLKAGANYVIVGRAIYRSDDPKRAAKEYYEKIMNWKKGH